jgi:hypothetical protein
MRRKGVTEAALGLGLEVWLSPELFNKTQATTLSHLAKAATKCCAGASQGGWWSVSGRRQPCSSRASSLAARSPRPRHLGPRHTRRHA